MASALGIPAFAGGAGAARNRPRRARPARTDPIAYAEYLGPLEAEERKWDERVQAYNNAKDEKVQKKGKRKGKLTKAALEARRKLPNARAKLARAKRELASAKTFGNRIRKFEELANIYADDMTAADDRNDSAGYNAARRRRRGALMNERTLLTRALEAAGGPEAKSAWARALRKKLGEAINETTDTDRAEMTVEELGTFTEQQQQTLDAIDAKLAVAELTDTKVGPNEDIEVLGQKLAFLRPLLAEAQGANRSKAVTEIAGMIRSAQDALGEATKPPDVTADQQALAAQAEARGFAAGRTESIDRLVAAVSGPGGGAARSMTVNFNSVMATPGQAREAADIIGAGFGYQQPRRASKTSVGV